MNVHVSITEMTDNYAVNIYISIYDAIALHLFLQVNLKTFDNKKNLEIKINYTYTCTNPGKRRDVCQGSRKGLFQQQMSLTIQVVGKFMLKSNHN